MRLHAPSWGARLHDQLAFGPGFARRSGAELRPRATSADVARKRQRRGVLGAVEVTRALLQSADARRVGRTSPRRLGSAADVRSPRENLRAAIRSTRPELSCWPSPWNSCTGRFAATRTARPHRPPDEASQRPSPGACSRRLVAADGTRQQCRVIGTELAWFESVHRRVIHAHPSHWRQRSSQDTSSGPAAPPSEPIRTRWPVRCTSTARGSASRRAIPASSTRAPTQVTLEALRRRDARVGYLGPPTRRACARRDANRAPRDRSATPSSLARGDAVIDVTERGDLGRSDVRRVRAGRHGKPAAVPGAPALNAYRSPSSSAEPVDEVAWWRGCASGRPSGRSSLRSRRCSRRPSSDHQSIRRTAGDPAWPRVAGPATNRSLPGPSRCWLPVSRTLHGLAGCLRVTPSTPDGPWYSFSGVALLSD